MDRGGLLSHTHSIRKQKSAEQLVEDRVPELRLDTGGALIVISLLSLGLWAGIWAVTFFGLVVLG